MKNNIIVNYLAPEAELIKIEAIDVITTSNPGDPSGGNGSPSNPTIGPWITID